MNRFRRFLIGAVGGVFLAAVRASVAFADNCSNELDCQQTQTYNTTTTVIGTAIGVGVAAISIVVSQTASTGAGAGAAVGAAGIGDAPDTDPTSPDGDAPPMEDLTILDGQDAIDALLQSGQIEPVTNPDGSTSYIPTSADLPDDGTIQGVIWGNNPDGTIDGPLVLVNRSGFGAGCC